MITSALSWHQGGDIQTVRNHSLPMAQSTHDAERKHHNIRQMLWYQEEETKKKKKKHYRYMEIYTQSIHAGFQKGEGIHPGQIISKNIYEILK